MENQNACAPGAEPVFEDVLDIPRPLRSTEPAAEQMLVLEDVIPAEEFSALDQTEETSVEGDDADEETLIRTAPAGLNTELGSLAGPHVYGASETSSFDYDNGRAWLRAAPLLLLLGVLVFFALYFIGNRMGNWTGKPREVAANPVQPEPSSTAPAAAVPATEKPDQTTAQAAPQTEASSAVAEVKDEKPAPVAQPSVEAARPAEPKPAAVVAPPAPTAAAPVLAAPPARQATGNFTVQVGSYNVSQQAEERAGRLRAGGVEARVVRAEIPGRGTWYRVQVGRFASQGEASRFGAELKGKGATDTFIITESQGQ